MDELYDIHLTKRLKSTLANFRSYCQKQSEQHSQVQQLRSKSNKSITKYRSIRQLKKYSQNYKQLQVSKTKRKEEEGQNIQGIFQIKSTDLIQIIKLKLKKNTLNLKTQGNQSKNQSKKYMNFKRYNPYQYDKYNNRKSTQIKNEKKYRKIQFFINNSKIKLSQNPKTKRQKRYQQYSITLNNRPLSAIDTHASYVNNNKSQFSLRYKVSPQKPSIKNSLKAVVHIQKIHNRVQMDKDKELSGWDVSDQTELLKTNYMYQQPSIQIHNNKKKY